MQYVSPIFEQTGHLSAIRDIQQYIEESQENPFKSEVSNEARTEEEDIIVR